jgi:hypothetical protein
MRAAQVPLPHAYLAQERFNEIKRKHLFDAHTVAQSALASRVASGKSEYKQKATAEAGGFQELEDE